MKQKILDNVSEYSAEQLTDYINNGTVTFNELVKDTDGQFSAEKRKKVQQLLKSGDSDEWNNVKQHPTIEGIQHYLDSFPNGNYRAEAREMKKNLELNSQKSDQQTGGDDAESINALINDDDEVDDLVKNISEVSNDKTAVTQTQRDNKIIDIIEKFINKNDSKKSIFLNMVKEDHNLISSGVVTQLQKKNIINWEDWVKYANIDVNFIKKVAKPNTGKAQILANSRPLTKVDKQTTEIYFWGIPSSGKSCALGAILSSAENGDVAHSMHIDSNSQGYDYLNRLKEIFKKDEIITLMEGTSLDSFYAMGFDLVDNKQKTHPITCIDMAGELITAMYKKNAGKTLTQLEQDMLDTLTNVLINNRSHNRKMHIFVIEYGAENKKYDDLTQNVYLDGAASYIGNTGIFKQDTDAIYIMITKTDKAKDATPDTLKNYILNNYKNFHTCLQDICKDNGINKGKVEIIAFSLGEVCFQNFCKFNSKPAENVVRILLDRSASFHSGNSGRAGILGWCDNLLWRLNNSLKG